MNLRFVQRQPGGPKVLQEWDGGKWQAVPLVEEWRRAAVPQIEPDQLRGHQGATVPTLGEALREMFPPGRDPSAYEVAQRFYPDSD